MVASDQSIAAEVGADILRRGGNAIDAAVAVGYAQAVVNPCCGNLGGGGFMTLRLADGKAVFLDFRERAPLAATRDMYLDAKGDPIPRASLDGWRAVAVPGTVLGLDMALQRYGTMRRAQVMAPAIALARGGFRLRRPDVDILASGAIAFAADREIGSIFLPGHVAPKPGQLLIQRKLAKTLSGIARSGPRFFYSGPIAARLAKASQAGGGLLTAADLAAYTVASREPVRCSYRGYDIISAPPPSSGGTTLCEILNIVEGYKLRDFGYGSSASAQLLIEAMRAAFKDRNSALGDPDFIDNPVAHLVSKDYAASLRPAIDARRAGEKTAPDTAPTGHEGTQTTHFSVVDKAGNAVAVTFSLNAYFGAQVMAPDTGFFLNDTMDDFTTKPGAANVYGLVQGAANAIAPGKRPLSSMTPTIIAKDGKPFLVLGSPGGSRIITAVAEAIINVVDYGMNVQEAVDAPRFHFQGQPDLVAAEPYAFAPDVMNSLREKGYTLDVQKPWGAVEAVQVGDGGAAAPAVKTVGDDTLKAGPAKAGSVYGANDNRRPAGAAIGP